MTSYKPIKKSELTIKPLYHCLICGLLKVVLFNRNSKSSLESCLLELPPILNVAVSLDEISSRYQDIEFILWDRSRCSWLVCGLSMIWGYVLFCRLAGEYDEFLLCQIKSTATVIKIASSVKIRIKCEQNSIIYLFLTSFQRKRLPIILQLFAFWPHRLHYKQDSEKTDYRTPTYT